MWLSARRDVRTRRRLWSDLSWPVLAGSAVAVGLVAAYETFGTANLFALYAPTAFMIAASLFCVHPEVTPPVATAVRWAGTGPLALIAALGVALVFSPFGLLVVTAVVVSSPPVLALAVNALGRLVGRDPAGCRGPTRAATTRLECERVDRQFSEIVSGLDDPGDSPGR